MTSRTGRLFAPLIGLTALAVLLQGLWAGIFLEHDGRRDEASGWIDVHARGADLAILLAAAATVVAFLALRARRDLWIGSGVLTALLVLEAYLGGLIRDQGKDTLTAVHVPLAMALMGMVVWLPLRARQALSQATTEAAQASIDTEMSAAAQ
jgi:heme A synthase